MLPSQEAVRFPEINLASTALRGGRLGQLRTIICERWQVLSSNIEIIFHIIYILQFNIINVYNAYHDMPSSPDMPWSPGCEVLQ